MRTHRRARTNGLTFTLWGFYYDLYVAEDGVVFYAEFNSGTPGSEGRYGNLL